MSTAISTLPALGSRGHRCGCGWGADNRCIRRHRLVDDYAFAQSAGFARHTRFDFMSRRNIVLRRR
jgi:hypothetical protein